MPNCLATAGRPLASIDLGGTPPEVFHQKVDMEEKLIFENYEIKGLQLGPRMYKIIAASVAINLVVLVVSAQGNLLTRKGCESPLVSQVCSVLDAVYLGSLVISTDAGYVDEDYEKTELSEAEITWVDTTGSEPLKYPDGYFALSNPTPTEAVPGMPTTDLSTIPITPSPVDINPATAPATLPTPNPNPIANLPNTPGDEVAAAAPVASPGRGRTRKPRAEPQPTPEPSPTPEDEIVIDPVTGVAINKRVMRDYANLVKQRVDNREVDLNQAFKIVAEAALTKEGKLDVTVDKKTKQPKSRVVLTEGDEQMVDIAKKAIEAVGDSGWLIYLRTQGIEKINYSIEQNAEQVMIVITSDQPTPERANTIMSGLKGTIEAALLLDQNNIKKLGDDERTLLQSATPISNGKQFILNFTISKQVAMEMITRRLQNMQPIQPSSTVAPSKDPRSKAE